MAADASSSNATILLKDDAASHKGNLVVDDILELLLIAPGDGTLPPGSSLPQ